MSLAASLALVTSFLFTASSFLAPAFLLPASHLFVVSPLLALAMFPVASHLFVASLFHEIADWSKGNNCSQSSVVLHKGKHEQISSQYREHTSKGKKHSYQPSSDDVNWSVEQPRTLPHDPSTLLPKILLSCIFSVLV